MKMQYDYHLPSVHGIGYSLKTDGWEYFEIEIAKIPDTTFVLDEAEEEEIPQEISPDYFYDVCCG
jgi:hypothetical protein